VPFKRLANPGGARSSWKATSPRRSSKNSVTPCRVMPARAAGGPVLCSTREQAGGGLRATEVWSTPPTRVAQILAAAKDYAPLLGASHNWDRKIALGKSVRSAIAHGKISGEVAIGLSKKSRTPEVDNRRRIAAGYLKIRGTNAPVSFFARHRQKRAHRARTLVAFSEDEI
jgi:hypothetical protein